MHLVCGEHQNRRRYWQNRQHGKSEQVKRRRWEQRLRLEMAAAVLAKRHPTCITCWFPTAKKDIPQKPNQKVAFFWGWGG